MKSVLCDLQLPQQNEPEGILSLTGKHTNHKVPKYLHCQSPLRWEKTTHLSGLVDFYESVRRRNET